MKSATFALLISSTSAIYMNKRGPIYPASLHWNEDPHSVPTPISGVDFFTSTQARLKADNFTGHIQAYEHKGQNPDYAFAPYNAHDAEYLEE